MGLNWQNLVWNNRVLVNSPRMVMFAIADKCNDKESSFEIDISTLAYLANICEKQTKRILHKLHTDKFITFRAGNGRGHKSKITISKEKLLETKGDIFDQNKTTKGGHFAPEKEDILNQSEEKGGHFEPIKGDILNHKGGHFEPTPPTPPYKELLPPFTTDITTERERDVREDKFPAEVADEIFGEPEKATELDDENIFSNSVLEGLRDRLKIFNEPEFLFQIEKLWKAEIFPVDQCLETYDLLAKIRKKKRGKWRIKAEYWAESVPHFEMLKQELEELENEEFLGVSNAIIKPNGTYQSERERREQAKLAEIAELESIRAGVNSRREKLLQRSDAGDS